MPGRNPTEAIKEYRERLQQSLSCLSKAVLKTTPYEAGVLQSVTLCEPTCVLKGQDNEVYHLAFLQKFSVTDRFLPWPFKVTTRAYYYALENESHKELIAYHWHPETSRVQSPHFHIGFGDDELRRVHFPTGRIAFEEFCSLLLNEIQVKPVRDDAKDVLEKNLADFRKHKTW